MPALTQHKKDEDEYKNESVGDTLKNEDVPK
jgi:hypothetical protein